MSDPNQRFRVQNPVGRGIFEETTRTHSRLRNIISRGRVAFVDERNTDRRICVALLRRRNVLLGANRYWKLVINGSLSARFILSRVLGITRNSVELRRYYCYNWYN